MFLELDGIKGESVDKVHKGKIDVRSFNWGLKNTGTFHHGSGGGAGKAEFQDIEIAKFTDKATADLMLACANGKHISKGILICRKAGENPLEYLKITMTEVLVSSVRTGSDRGDELPVENVTLNCAKVQVEYFMQGASGGKEAGGTMGWHIAGNSKL
jgi:type VI secretion system secreted protein Hcp